MAGKNYRRLIAALVALLAVLPVSAQKSTEQKDSLIRLVKASSLHIEEEFGTNYRKAYDATFLHNGTYLICDTANWNVDLKVINAIGHVQILQDETSLVSDKLDYYIDEDRAEFRGSVVELKNKENNVLRTRYLDYNTKDSVALFFKGAAMRSKDGQIIESIEGSYDSKIKLFSFNRNVNMYTDTTFIKTEGLEYDSGQSRVIFTNYVDFWNDDNMMSANRGWYDRENEVFFFNDKVHATSKDQEAWTDSLYVYRKIGEVLLLGNAQIQDSLHSSAALADYILYQDTVSTVTLRRNAAVALITDRGTEKEDTVYLGADTLIYRSVRKCDIGQEEIDAAKTRIENIHVDPVTEYRERAAQAAAEAAAKKSSESGKEGKDTPEASEEPESEEQSSESESQAEGDQVEPESEPEPEPEVQEVPDTTKIGFAKGQGNVRIFRKDIQVRSELMHYNDLDSIARFYDNPIVWNEGSRQYSSDSLFVLVSNGGVDRANLMSNAFIINQEDSLFFDQIRGAEVMAYFDSTSALRRFDALGGADAMFFLKENDHLATVNLVTSKMLSAILVDGEVNQVYYYDSPNNDAYPVAQLPKDKQKMKGFNWQNDNRPKGKNDITTLQMRASQRKEYASHPHTEFHQTDIYFPGYIKNLYKQLAVRDSLKKLPKPAVVEQVSVVDTAILAETADTAAAVVAVATDAAVEADAVVDSVADTPAAVADSVETVKSDVPEEEGSDDTDETLSEDIAQQTDTTVVESVPVVIDPRIEERARKQAEQARKKAEKDSIYALKDSLKEAHWAYLDSLDAAKDQAKADKKLLKKREKTKRQVIAMRRRENREKARLERYIRLYEKRKAREEMRKNKIK